jgi:uncharacterized membrane protein
LEKTRVEFFSDAVFAIAMTLLVLDLKVPEGANGHLVEALRHEWPTYAGFLISFSLIGVIWVNHHALFQDLAGLNRVFLFLNLLLLACIVVIPFPTSLVTTYIRSSTDGHIAVAVYSAVMLSMATTFSLLWLWSVKSGLWRWQLSRSEFRMTAARAAVGVVVYSVAIGLSFVNAAVTLGLHAVVAVFYVLDQCVRSPSPHQAEAEDVESRL